MYIFKEHIVLRIKIFLYYVSFDVKRNVWQICQFNIKNLGLFLYVMPPPQPHHFISLVIRFYCILQKYRSERGWKWRMWVLQRQCERNWLRFHCGSKLQTEPSRAGAAAAPLAGSWRGVMLAACLRPLSFCCFCSFSEPPAIPPIPWALWLLSHFILKQSVPWFARQSSGWYILFGLHLLLYWSVSLSRHFPTSKNQLWHLGLPSSSPLRQILFLLKCAEMFLASSAAVATTTTKHIKGVDQFGGISLILVHLHCKLSNHKHWVLRAMYYTGC